MSRINDFNEILNERKSVKVFDSDYKFHMKKWMKS